MQKLVKDLAAGDRVALEDGSAVIVKIERCHIIDVAPKMGGAWEVSYKNEANGERGMAVVSGLSQLELCQ